MVNTADMLILLTHYGRTSQIGWSIPAGESLMADINCDHMVSAADLLVLMQNIGTICDR